METIICLCLKCNAELGRFENVWNGIGNTYISPISEPISIVGLKTTGDVYEAARGSTIQFSLLRDVACDKCKTILGLHCDNAPEGHILKQNQLILRLKEMSTVSENSGETANVSILKTIPLKNSITPCTSTLCKSFLPLIPFQNNTALFPGVNENLSERLHDKTTLVEPPFKTEVAAAVESFPSQPNVPSDSNAKIFSDWVNNMIQYQRRDIDRISEKVIRIEEELQSMKKIMEEIRIDLTASLQVSDYNEKFVEVKSEIKKLAQKVNQAKKTDWNVKTSLLARNLEKVARDIKNVSTEVGDTKELRLTHDLLASRVQQLEEKIKANNFLNYSDSFKGEIEGKLPKKRTNNLVKGVEIPSQARSTSFPMKKRCLDEFSDLMKESLEATNKKLQPEVIDLVSLKSRCCLGSSKSQSLDIQAHQLKHKIGITSKKPQVLIQSSIHEIPQQPDPRDLQPDMNRRTVKGSLRTSKTSVTRADKKLMEAEAASRNKSVKSNQVILGDEFSDAGNMTSKENTEVDIDHRELTPHNSTHTNNLTRSTRDKINEDEVLSSIENNDDKLAQTSARDLLYDDILQARWQCKDCKEVFRSSKFLQNHRRKSLDCRGTKQRKRKPFVCESCGKRYKAAEGLQNHYQRTICVPLLSSSASSATSPSNQSSSSNSAPKIHCNLCEKMWGSRKQYDKHKCFSKFRNPDREIEDPV